MTEPMAQGPPPPPAHYRLRLYIAGMTARSTAAIVAMKALCRDALPDCHDLEVIDIYQHPQLAKDDDVIALPTIIKMSPMPSRRCVGDLTDRDRVLAELGLARAA